jgi:ABC-type amino acid transport substrate-binding protein
VSGGYLPLAFFNRAGDLVGFDAEMAHSLAHSLNVDLTFVPVGGAFNKAPFAEALESGYCDLGTTRTALSMAGIHTLDYSESYISFNIAFLTRDHRRREFATVAEVAARDDLRIGMPNDPYYFERIHAALPQAELVPIDGIQEFIDAKDDDLDAMIVLAEVGSAWTLRYPDFSVVVPRPGIERVPLAYLLPGGEPDWVNTVDSWVRIKKVDGTISRLFDYWILGREAERSGPRWSIIRDVLHWID